MGGIHIITITITRLEPVSYTYLDYRTTVNRKISKGKAKERKFEPVGLFPTNVRAYYVASLYLTFVPNGNQVQIKFT